MKVLKFLYTAVFVCMVSAHAMAAAQSELVMQGCWPADGTRSDLQLTIQQFSPTQIQLSWSPYPGLSEYIIYKSDSNHGINNAGWQQAGDVMGITFIDYLTSPRQFYQVRPKVVATPVFNPPSGYYTSLPNITLSCFTPGAGIFYSKDYQHIPLTVSSYPPLSYTMSSYPLVIRAWGYKYEWPESNEVFGVYSYPPQIYQPSPLPNTNQTILDDMNLPGEGVPHGANEWSDWYLDSEIDTITPPPFFNAFTCWGVLYQENRAVPVPNTRVQIRNMRAKYWSTTDHQWHSLQDNGSGIFGKYYREDFDADSSFAADILYYEDGSISATAGNGKCFHFWIVDRQDITNLPIGGIYVTFEARLINTNGVDDRLNARYIMEAGADYWTSVQGGTNTSIGMGRFKYVTTEWKSFNFCTNLENLP